MKKKLNLKAIMLLGSSLLVVSGCASTNNPGDKGKVGNHSGGTTGENPGGGPGGGSPSVVNVTPFFENSDNQGGGSLIGNTPESTLSNVASFIGSLKSGLATANTEKDKVIIELKKVKEENTRLKEDLKKFNTEKDTAIIELKKFNTEKDKSIEDLKKFNGEKDKTIEVLKKSNTEKDTVIIKLEKVKDENTRLKEDLEKSNGEKDTAIIELKKVKEENTRLKEDLKNSNGEKDETIEVLKKFNTEKDTAIIELEKVKDENTRLKEDLKNSNGEKDETIEVLKKSNGEKDTAIIELKKINGEKDTAIIELKKFMGEKDKTIEDLKIKLQINTKYAHYKISPLPNSIKYLNTEFSVSQNKKPKTNVDEGKYCVKLRENSDITTKNIPFKEKVELTEYFDKNSATLVASFGENFVKLIRSYINKGETIPGSVWGKKFHPDYKSEVFNEKNHMNKEIKINFSEIITMYNSAIKNSGSSNNQDVVLRLKPKKNKKKSEKELLSSHAQPLPLMLSPLATFEKEHDYSNNES